MSKVREYEHVPTPDILGAAVVHCTSCGKRLAPHDAFPVREEGGRWSCIVCPSSITPRTFTAPMLDASKPGLVRDVTIEVHSRSLIVRVAPARIGGEDAPHHRAADFTGQRAAIVAAFSEVVTEIAKAAKVELHGSAPPPDAVRLYTHAELPAWVKPDAHHESNVSYFYGRPDAAEVWQAIFGVDTIGAMFLDLVQHEPKKKSRILNGDVTPLPGCVLVAVGVEQIRRARAGR